MDPNSDEKAIGVDHYGWVLRRQWKIIVAGALIGLLAAGAYLFVSPQRSTATTDVSITVISTAPFDASSQSTNLLDATTETQIATSYAVAKRAAQMLGDVDAKAVRRATQVDAVTDKDVVHVEYTAASAVRARSGANAVAAAYLAYRSTQAQTKQRAILAGNQVRLSALKKQLNVANGQIAIATPGSSEANRANSDHDLIVTELNSIVTQQTALQQIDTSGGSVLTAAENNPVTVGPNLLVVLLAGLLAGAVLGVIVAFPLNARDRRWRTAREVMRGTGAPVLGSVLDTRAQVPETGQTIEILRSARELLASELPAGARVLTIVDDTAGDQPSDIPANFALALASDGRLVELLLPGVDDDRAYLLRTGLELEHSRDEEPDVALRSGIVRSLHVVFPAPGDELVSAVIRSRVGSTKSRQFYVLALPSGAPRSSVLAAIRVSNAVLLVAELGSIRSNDVNALLAEADTLGTKFVGTITVPHGRRIDSEHSVAASE